MATVKLGRVRPVFKGDYDPSVPYEAMDCARRNGNLYQALRDVPVGALPEAPDSIYWMLTGMKGADGLDGRDGADGAPGPQGEPGPQGIQGEQGPQGPAGADGATGPRGPAGAQGPKGDTPPLYSGVDSAAKDVAASAFAVKTAYDKVVDVAKPRYAVCSTAAGTAEKTITLENFELVTGAQLIVHFTVTNTAANPTLNVNNTGAKPIRYKAKAISAGSLTAGSTHALVCAGGSYELVTSDSDRVYAAIADGEHADVVQVLADNNNRVGTIRVSNAEGSNSLLLGVHDEKNSPPQGITIYNVDGKLTAGFPGRLEVNDLTVTGGGSSSIPGVFPVGGIILWSGAVNAIPSGWALCDGNNGTPDLRDRFVVGAGYSYAVGAQGGNNTVVAVLSGTIGATTLSVEQSPIHSHSLGTKGRTPYSNEGNGSANIIGGPCYEGIPQQGYTDNAGGNGYHTHTVTGNSLVDTRSPYLALAYIMKLAEAANA